jgi:enoyl-CoA hydratase
MSDVVSVADDRVVTIIIDRPDRRNAVDVAACDAIADAVDAAVAGGARAIVLAGANGHFCAGADIAEIADVGVAIRRCLDALRSAPIVTLAAVDGFALGAGVQLAVACDLRVATPTARFGVPAAKLGVAIDHTTVQQVAGMLGGSQARALLLASEEIDGQRAYDLGFVNRLGGLADAQQWAAEIAARAPLTIAAHKLALNRLEQPLSDQDVIAAVNRAWSSADLQEGRAAFAAKRTPRFSGE